MNLSRFTGFFTCLGLATACSAVISSAWGQAAPAAAPLTLSHQTVQLAVPFEKQETARQCGLAAAKMVCGYYGQKFNETQEDWLKTVSKAGDGIMGSELVVSLRAADYDTAVFQGTLDKKKTGLYYHLDKRRPLVIMITSKDGKASHYDVLTGYDAKNSLLLVLDPASGPLTLSTVDLLPAWKRANYFTLLAVPKKLNAQATPAVK